MGQKFDISQHARQRWEERFGSRDMVAELLSAVPFGAQKDSAVLLLNGDAVFVVKNDSVITCLTKDMAISNMQATGIAWKAVTEEGHAPPKPICSRPQAEGRTIGKVVKALAAIGKSECAMISQILTDCSEDELKHLAETTKLSNICNLILKLKEKAEKNVKHARRIEMERSSLTQAMRMLLGAEIKDRVVKKAIEIREAKESMS